ncbi:MAG: diaminopimelate epimerase [Candidatus Altiarchaeales archaeon ex4484_2]|nr:MAG: diaminopimelate epimerase [Candidatus Altiarchaeales archaeon ex4484_2]
MKISFVKMQGAGNDFILIDEYNGIVVPDPEKTSLVSKISDRRFGVGSDGVVFIQKTDKADARFVFYNPDGSRAELCGNGIRCFAKYVYESGLVRKNPIVAETGVGLLELELSLSGERVSQVKVDMGVPRLERIDIPVSGEPEARFIDEEVEIEGVSYQITAVGMGNPHAVLFCDDVDDVDLPRAGEEIRNHSLIFPEGVNVHFVEDVGVNEFRIRTYERGVEGETLACGTGICASAMAAVVNNKADRNKKIIFHARGGDLIVEFIGEHIYLKGPALEVFRGEFPVY